MPVGRIKNRMMKTQRAGIIRLGRKIPTQNGKSRPSDVEYFVLDEAPELKEIYGETPQELDIMFTSDDEDVVASNYLRMYRCSNPNEPDKNKRKNFLTCIGEGEDPNTGTSTYANWIDNKPPQMGFVPVTEEMRAAWAAELEQIRRDLADPNIALESPTYSKRRAMTLESWLTGRSFPRLCHQNFCPDYAAKKCKEVLTMTFKVLRGPHVFGEYQLHTGSKNGMRAVFNCLEDARNLVRKYRPDLPYGRIAGIPFRLKRVLTQINVPNKDGRMEKNGKWILRMDVNPQFSQFFAKQLQGVVSQMLLEAPPEDTQPTIELGGASPNMAVCPEDLYPTEEEVQAQVEHEMAQQTRNEDWLQDPETLGLIIEWEHQQGRTIPEGKRRAIVKNYNTIEEFKAAIRRNLNVQIDPTPL